MPGAYCVMEKTSGNQFTIFLFQAWPSLETSFKAYGRNARYFLRRRRLEKEKACLVFEFCLVRCGKTSQKVEMRRGELGLSHSLLACGGGLNLHLKTCDYLGFDKWKSPNQLYDNL